IYLAGNNGREALLSYLQALTIGLWGPTPWALRAASAFAGTVAVGVAYGLARALPTRRPRLLAMATAALMAVSVWPLHFSRIGIRGILMPLFGGAFSWALWRAEEAATVDGGSEGTGGRSPSLPPTASLRRHALAGALLGAALYAHPAARVMPLVPVLLIGARAFGAWRRDDRAAARRAVVGLVVLAAAAVAVAAPLIAYALAHRDAFFGHSIRVSILAADNRSGGLPRRIGLNAWRTLRAFFWDGSDSWYHNVKGRPVFDAVTAAMACIGVWSLARTRVAASTRRGEPGLGAFAAISLIVLALPAVLTGGAPNFSRSVGLMPIAFLVPAIGYAVVAEALARFAHRRWAVGATDGASAVEADDTRTDGRTDDGRTSAFATFALVVLLVPAGVSTLRAYFGRYAASPAAAEAFGAATRAKAESLRALALAGDGRVLAPAYVAERAVYRFLLDDVDVAPIDASAGLVVPAAGPAWLVFDADTDGDAAEAMLERWPTLQLTEQRAARGWRTFRVDHAPDELGNTVPVGAVFATVTLEAAAGGQSCDALPPEADLLCSSDAHSIDLALRWHVDATTDRDWTAFAHLVEVGDVDDNVDVDRGAAANGDGRTVAQHDGVPLAGSLPTSRWRAGDTVIDRFVLRIPDGVPAGRYRLRVGWYDAVTGERMALRGGADGAADVAAVEVR
ncbi:MAG: hypothetical protein ABI780_11245, partial [Ardenticatenales bacterium]